MKKIKKKFIPRLAALFCALVVAASCLGSVPYYASYPDIDLDMFLDNKESLWADDEYVELYNSVGLSDAMSAYPYIIIQEATSGNLYAYGSTSPFVLVFTSQYLYFDNSNVEYCEWYSSGNGYWVSSSVSTSNTYIAHLSRSSSTGDWANFYSDFGIVYTSSDLCYEGTCLISSSGSLVEGSFNSSIGYLQDLLCKELYLEDADYAYDPDALKKVWTFANTSTTGLDITDGTYSVRHYQQITVRDSGVDPIVKEYDMILMNEFPAASCRYEYMSKDYSTRLESESGFEPLSFWDTTVLGRFVFTRNYFQLVKTNEDGSVEYGGYVKIDLKGSPAANDLNAEHETTTITPEGEVDNDGYVGGDMDYIQGSGSDYGQAENNADKEAAENAGSSDGLVDKIGDISSTILVIPEVIARLFSFLPDWCLDIVGIAFGLSIGILVFKLAN